MNLTDLNWIRKYSHKLDRELRSELIAHYRDVSRVPCVLQRVYRFFRQKFKKYPVIVQLESMRDISEEQIYPALQIKERSVQKLKIINSFSAQLPLNTVKSLACNSLVSKVFLDKDVHTLLDTAIPSIKSDLTWDLGYTGKGVTIAILDSGLSPHPDFILPQDRIVSFKDFVNNQTQPYDDNGHGTHCAGSAAGNGFMSKGKFRGPAYEANIAAVKVLDKLGVGKSSLIIQGLEWCLVNKDALNLKVVSLSFGYKAEDSHRKDPVCQAVGKLWHNGIVICAAAGNEGPEPSTINSPGIHPDIITVGAANDNGTSLQEDDLIADFSSRGPTIDGICKPDLLLPGTAIFSARAINSYLDKINFESNSESWYLQLSGTSMSTPICAGIIAQLIQAKPHLTPDNLKELLISSCTLLHSVDCNSQGNGILDAFRALTSTIHTRTDLTS